MTSGAGWDEMFATLPRLKVAAYLSGCGQAEFGVVAAATELSPPTLSKATVSLEGAGYLDVRKGHIGRRPRTWLALTDRGRAAFQAHMDAVHSLAEGHHARQRRPGDGERDGLSRPGTG